MHRSSLFYIIESCNIAYSVLHGEEQIKFSKKKIAFNGDRTFADWAKLKIWLSIWIFESSHSVDSGNDRVQNVQCCIKQSSVQQFHIQLMSAQLSQQDIRAKTSRSWTLSQQKALFIEFILLFPVWVCW